MNFVYDMYLKIIPYVRAHAHTLFILSEPHSRVQCWWLTDHCVRSAVTARDSKLLFLPPPWPPGSTSLWRCPATLQTSPFQRVMKSECQARQESPLEPSLWWGAGEACKNLMNSLPVDQLREKTERAEQVAALGQNTSQCLSLCNASGKPLCSWNGRIGADDSSCRFQLKHMSV